MTEIEELRVTGDPAAWRPVTLADLPRLLHGAPFPWWIAGGHAIEHLLGQPVRAHADLDLMLLRRDQAAARAWFANWEWWTVIGPGRLQRWRGDHARSTAVSGIWTRDDAAGPWRIEWLIDEHEGDEWVSRRDPRVRLPLARLGAPDEHGARWLAPEIQLFYKAKTPRPKDELDFAAATPRLTPGARDWLRWAIVTVYGAAHPWIERLGAGSQFPGAIAGGHMTPPAIAPIRAGLLPGADPDLHRPGRPVGPGEIGRRGQDARS